MGLIQLLQSMTHQELIETQNTNNNWRESELTGKQGQTAARSAMIKADANGNLVAATEGTDYGKSTIDGFASQSWSDAPGLDTAATKHIMLTGLDERQQYLVNITGCPNPNGSPQYNATLCGILSFAVGYLNGAVTVKAILTPLFSATSTAMTTDANFGVMLEGGGQSLPYTTWSSDKHCYLVFSRESTSSTIGYWHISIKKLLNL